jgi:hypothetical protein
MWQHPDKQKIIIPLNFDSSSEEDSDTEPTPEEHEQQRKAYEKARWDSYKVNLPDLVKLYPQLIELSTLTPRDVMEIFIESGEERIEDFDNIPHTHDMPLYKKMILRFQREGIGDPACFIKTSHPTSQRQVCSRYKIWDEKIFEFFAYIKFGYGAYQIDEMGMSSAEWKSNNAIRFFFDLKTEFQLKFVEEYNATFDKR